MEPWQSDSNLSAYDRCMARLPRLTIPGYLHHVIQRGNNRERIFTSAGDYEFMLALLAENARKYEVSIHAYVLMTNHFHLLATPDTAIGLPHMMQAVGRRYVRYFNDGHGRSGTLWEGRYKSTLIEADRHLLACMAYIDLNPVRAGMVTEVRSYPWSSHGHYVGLRQDKLVTPHALYWELGNTPFAREAAYAQLVHAGLTAQQLMELTQSAMYGWALGTPEFTAHLQNRTGRRVSKAAAGRPRVASKVIAK